VPVALGTLPLSLVMQIGLNWLRRGPVIDIRVGGVVPPSSAAVYGAGS
jgi:hypothetical protein